MAARVREAFFLDSPDGGRFCLVTRPAGAIRGALLYLHPFAEELNKSRRMVALAARAFAESGWAVLQVDQKGCGDSGGDFGDVDWHDWVADVERAWQWLQGFCAGQAPGVPQGVWTLRAGSLMAAEWLQSSSARPPLLLWQPVSNGKQHLTQFLRMKAAAEMLSDADARGVMARVRANLQAGEAVEVGGYAVSPALAAGMDAAVLRLPPDYTAPVAILEVSGAEPPESSPAVRLLVDKWQAAGVPVMAEAVSGAGFWQTQEIETAPGLIAPSVRFLQGLKP